MNLQQIKGGGGAEEVAVAVVSPRDETITMAGPLSVGPQ